MSDIHGNAKRFKSVMKQIKFKKNDTLFVLGDVIDRHPGGIKILRKLMKMPNVFMLLGNHEYMMLNVLDRSYDPESFEDMCELEANMERWYRNSGGITQRALAVLPERERTKIFKFLRSLPLNFDIYVDGKPFKLIHGSPTELYDENDKQYESLAEFAVWSRWQLTDPDVGNGTVIFGHTPTEYFKSASPFSIFHSEDGKRIGIDCGSGYALPGTEKFNESRHGRLACLRLNDMQEFYSEM